MRGEARGLCVVWLAIGGVVACASPPRKPASESPAQHEGPPPPAGGDEAVAQLEREIDVHSRRLEHSDPEERVQGQLALADAYQRRGEQQLERLFQLDELRASASADRRAELDRLIAECREEEAAWYQRAASLYQEVLASSSPEALRGRAEARYGLASVRRRLGDPLGAVDLLEALVRDDPEHGLAWPARLELGDHAFAEQRFAEARGLYEEALRSSNARDHAYASYKLGWIAVNLDDGGAALEHWARVVERTRGDATQRSLGEAAAKDCVLAFAMVGRPEDAVKFFRRLHPALAPELLRRLAQHYRDRGQPEAALVVQAGMTSP